MTRVKYKQPCNTGGREEDSYDESFFKYFFLALIQNNLAPIQDAGAN